MFNLFYEYFVSVWFDNTYLSTQQVNDLSYLFSFVSTILIYFVILTFIIKLFKIAFGSL